MTSYSAAHRLLSFRKTIPYSSFSPPVLVLLKICPANHAREKQQHAFIGSRSGFKFTSIMLFLIITCLTSAATKSLRQSKLLF